MITQVSKWLFDSLALIFNGILTWGIIGFGMVSVYLIGRIINLIKKFFR